MAHSIKGQVVFITGASSGIGKACAEQFAQNGAHVVVTARRLDRLKEMSENLAKKHGIRCLPFELDVRNYNQIESIFKILEKEKMLPDIVINNAGIALSLDKMQEARIENWDAMIDTNIKGLLYITKAALPSMIEKNQGHIINIGSVAGRGVYSGGNIYCATKYAVKAISESLRLDLIGTSIRVSEIAPGAVETEFSQVRFNDCERAKKVYQGFDPLLADDIADTVVYCATRPPHVNIAELVVFPQAQASLRDIHRKDPLK